MTYSSEFEEIDNDSNGHLTKGEFQKYVKRSKESVTVAPTPGAARAAVTVTLQHSN